jgi:hypothetical protein
LENEVLRRELGYKKQEVTAGWRRRLHSEDFILLFVIVDVYFV